MAASGSSFENTSDQNIHQPYGVTFFAPSLGELTTSQLTNLRTQVNALLNHVVRGEQKEAEDILKTNPKLLLSLLQSKAIVTDYSGRTIEGTALQIALGAEDVKYHQDEECMVEMLLRYLRQLPNDENIIAAQIAEQFPAGYEQDEKVQTERDLAALREVVNAIEKSGPKDDCESELQAFIDYLEREKQSKGVIKTGKHFNVQLLVEAFKLYREKYSSFGGWGSRRNNLFWSKVIGQIQRYLPACYAQAFCQGIFDMRNNQLKLTRDLTFRNAPGIYFYGSEDLGKTAAADLEGLSWDAWENTLASQFFGRVYVEQKISTLQSYITGQQPEEKPQHFIR